MRNGFLIGLLLFGCTSCVSDNAVKQEPEPQYFEPGIRSGFSLNGDLGRGDIISNEFPMCHNEFETYDTDRITVGLKFSVDKWGHVMPDMELVQSSGIPEWNIHIMKVLNNGSLLRTIKMK